MQALVTTFPKPYEPRILDIWQDLKDKFEIDYIQSTTIPHFTWQIGLKYSLQAVTPLLEQIAAETQPFEIAVEGVETFVSQAPVVFLKIIPIPNLIKLHTRLWNALLPYLQEPNLLYSPGLWRPHITLAMQDLSWEQLKPVLDYLMALKLSWRITVDQFSILQQDANGTTTLLHHFQFSQGKIY
jgi:2'-5' RNA ligase